MDNIDRNTFEILKLFGVRGLFDDFMWYQYFFLHPSDARNFERPHQIPIMLGAAFAIRRDFFYDLGQYDEGARRSSKMFIKIH